MLSEKRRLFTDASFLASSLTCGERCFSGNTIYIYLVRRWFCELCNSIRESLTFHPALLRSSETLETRRRMIHASLRMKFSRISGNVKMGQRWITCCLIRGFNSVTSWSRSWWLVGFRTCRPWDVSDARTRMDDLFAFAKNPWQLYTWKIYVKALVI